MNQTKIIQLIVIDLSTYPYFTYKRRKSHDNQSSHFGLILEITRQSYERSPVPKSKMKLVSQLFLEFCTR